MGFQVWRSGANRPEKPVSSSWRLVLIPELQDSKTMFFYPQKGPAMNKLVKFIATLIVGVSATFVQAAGLADISMNDAL